jgi:hypothetical protein
MGKDETPTVQEHRDKVYAGVVKAGGIMPGTPWRRYGWSIVLVLTLALLSCSGDGAPSLTGTWTGTIQDSAAGTGTALFTLSGTAGDNGIALTLFASQSQACSFTVVANFDGDDRFTGTYTAFNCALPQSGSLDVHRQ